MSKPKTAERRKLERLFREQLMMVWGREPETGEMEQKSDSELEDACKEMILG